ncbi:MAG: 16S rRNA (cytosine(1402)-N(4))-methyltransferase RsmH [Clostridia bacterium]
MEFTHNPVLLTQCLDGLNITGDGIYVDGTLGRAGHSFHIAKRLTTGKLIGIDRDMAAIDAGRTRLSEFNDKIILIHSDFRNMAQALDSVGIDLVDGILLDLGVSSPQLDDASRGFSYMADAPLDMRMDRTSTLSAYDIVNLRTENELKKIFYEYGEERYAPRIAAEICRVRANAPIESTLQLVDIIKRAMPASALREKQHPAKRTFQAIRIAVNDELRAIEQVLDSAVSRLKIGGRIAVITFHSLEDRLVKRGFLQMANPCICPPELPVCGCGRLPKLKVITRKPCIPSDDEIARNPRARSAKLRIAERV